MTNRGYALHVGVPAPAPLGDRTFARLPGTIRDADKLSAITAEAGFEVTILAGSDATTKRVLEELRAMCSAAVDGDAVIVTFSGHGWQIRTRDPQEPDKYDEIWMLHDGYLVDTSVGTILHSCTPDVTVVAILDACRSRTGTFAYTPDVTDVPLDKIMERIQVPDIVDDASGASRPAATVLTLSAVDRDDAPSYENDSGGVFTTALQDSWTRLCATGTPPTWGQLWSRTVGHVHAWQKLHHSQWPHATLRGVNIAVLELPAFTV